MEVHAIHSQLPAERWAEVAHEAVRWRLPRGKVAGQLIALGLETLREREAAGDPVPLGELVRESFPRREGATRE